MNKQLRRPVLWLFDGLFVCLLSALYLACFATPAQAYVDPSVVTYTIQALAGVAVALSAVLGVVWRRLRKRLYKALNIDENRDKVHDPVVHEVNPASDEGQQLLREANHKALEDEKLVGPHKPQNLRWAPRFVLSLVAWGCLIYSLGVVTPLSMMASSLDSFIFGLDAVTPALLVFAAALWLGLSALTSLVRGRAFTVVAALIGALSVAVFAQSSFMNAGLPVADGKEVVWGDFLQITLVSSLVWVALMAAAVAWALFSAKTLKAAVVILSIVLVGVQSGVLVSSLQQAEGDLASMGAPDTLWTGRPMVTTQDRDTVSEGHNVVMFVLDTVDNGYFDQVLAQYPDIVDDYTGFTHYANCSGMMIPTRYAMADLVTGYCLTDEDDAYGTSVISSWYAAENLVDAMKDNGYSVDIYSTDMPQGTSSLQGRADNIHGLEIQPGFWPTVSSLWKMSLYRSAPWALKPPFWFYSGDIANDILSNATGDTPFILDDAQYLEDLKENGLASEENEDVTSRGTYKLIHMMGSHYPVTLDDQGRRVSEEDTDVVKQTRGALLAVEQYMSELKRLDIYDETTIIVTADHGYWDLEDDILRPTSPFLLVKPAEDAAQAADPMKTSWAPVSQHDLAATLLKAMGDPSYHEWGTPVDEVPEDQPRTRYYDATSVADYHDYYAIKEWEINGDVRDWDAWTETGKQWPIAD